MEHRRSAMSAGHLAGSRRRLARVTAWQIAFAALAIARSGALPAEVAKPALHGAGDIELTLLPPRGEAAPASVSVRFEPPPSGSPGRPAERATVACRAAGERWRCRLPSGRWDFRVEASGFTPQYLWQIDVASGKVKSLGALGLVRGSSLVGRVETANGAPVSRLCRIELVPSGLALLRAEDPRRAEARSTTAGARGFFQLGGITPGSYALSVSQPGFATTTLLPVVIERDQETRLDQPLVLTLPLQLEVEVTPALDPWGQPWRAVLMRKELALAKFREAAGGPVVDGRFVHRGMDPGLYTLDIRDSQGASFLSEDVELDRDRTLFREIALVLVEGHVSKGDDPYSTRLGFFKGSRGAAIRMDSDAKGFFTGYLPQEGRWRVDLPELHRTMRNVRVERQKGARAAKLDLVIPDRRITGEVVDESSNPVAGAMVRATDFVDIDEQSTWSDQRGAFVLDGVPERPHDAWAEAERDGHLFGSDPVTVTPSKEAASPGIRLVLHEKKWLAGVVTAPAGPVAGARLFATPRGRLNVLLSDATSDESGRFRLDVPAAADELQIQVMPPGFALRTLSVQAPFPDPLSIAVDDAGGSLVLRTPALDLVDPLQATPLIVVGGQPLSLDTLLSWARMSGESQRDPRRYEIPRLAAGDYSACLLTLPEQIQVILGLAALTGKSCDHGTLAPHGELVLDLGGAR